MSWIVEESVNTSSIKINDPADRNGQYFWKLEFSELDPESGGNVSIGLTTEQGFNDGHKLRAIQYMGHLIDGTELLKQSFGDAIKRDDKVDILLQLTDEDLKMYIFHNDRPLGLAFHIQSPYPRPLYPVVTFNSNGKVTISRSQQIPSKLDRPTLPFTDIEGHWKIVNYPQHPEAIGCQLEINRHENDENTLALHAAVVNSLNCLLQHDPTSNLWETSHIMSTEKGGPPEEMKKERSVNVIIHEIRNLKVQGENKLTIEMNNNEQVQLERSEKAELSPVTEDVLK